MSILVSRAVKLNKKNPSSNRNWFYTVSEEGNRKQSFSHDISKSLNASGSLLSTKSICYSKPYANLFNKEGHYVGDMKYNSADDSINCIDYMVFNDINKITKSCAHVAFKDGDDE